MILYDSITGTNLDTLQLNESGDEFFLNAAPVDQYGLTSLEDVREFRGEIILDQNEIDNFFNEANKIIVVASFSSYGAGIGINDVSSPVRSVKIMKDYSLDFRFNIDAEILYIDNGD